MEPEIFYLIVFLIGVVGSFIGAISAGPGIIIFSGLTLLGIPPHVAVALYTFSDIGSRLSSLHSFVKNNKVVWNLVLPLTILGIVGSVIGANLLVSLNEEILSKIVGVVLLLLIPIIFLNKNFGLVQVQISKAKRRITHVWYFLVEIWSAFFPPGSGFLIQVVMTKGYGLTLLQTKGTRRIPGLIAEISATIVFFMAGLIDFKIGFVLIAGAMLGSYVGSHLAIKKGDAWVRPLIVIMIVVVSIKMIFFT